ncbi:hypothetical protein LTR72_010541 [Exophiala xenobiotica]|nr:hypothetical protein LTR72_010541 [Exophiala xenobiotica]KAK5473655.1 hypothetical protein LTR55_010189 [Exophiala xenobiotica]
MEGLASQPREAGEADATTFYTPCNDGFPIHRVYLPFPADQQSIRLVHLLPGSGRDPINCRLSENIPLVSEKRKAAIAYEALSYAAGDLKGTEEIRLNGWSFKVFGNLFLALSQLRFPETERLLWVDQLCINQIDIPERNSSVLLMCDIYRQATSTVVWLGPAKEGTIQAVQFVNEFLEQHREDLYQHLLGWGQRRNWARHWQRATLKEQTQFSDVVVDFLLSQRFWIELPHIYRSENSGLRDDPVAKAIHWMKNSLGDASKETVIESIREMFSTGWWARFWTLQEAVVSETLMLQCGSSCLRWDDFTLFAEVVTAVSRWRDFTEEGKGTTLSTMTSPTFRMRSLIRSQHVGNGILELLDETRHLRASDPRDQVYSVLGILGKQKRRAYGIKPSYSNTNTIANVMATVAKAAVQTDHEWPFAYLSGHEARRGFPTWVPDFYDTRIFRRFRSGWSQEAKKLWVDPSFFDHGRRMRVLAIKLGIVEVIRKLRERNLYVPEPEDVLQERYRLVMKRARDHKEPCSLRLLKEFLGVVHGTIGQHGLPKQHDWQSPTNLDQRALDRIFTQVQCMERQAKETSSIIINQRYDFFILQDGTMGLLPSAWDVPSGEVGDIVYVLPSLDTPMIVRTATDAEGCFTVVRSCEVSGVMNGEVIDQWKQGEKMLEEIDLI